MEVLILGVYTSPNQKMAAIYHKTVLHDHGHHVGSALSICVCKKDKNKETVDVIKWKWLSLPTYSASLILIEYFESFLNINPGL